MKKVLLIAVTVVLVAAAAFLLFNKDPKALNVNDVGNPAAQKGVIAVTGIVAAPSDFYKDIFGIMDTNEATCNKGCEKRYIAVKYQGDLPKAGDEIRAKGQFTKVGDYYLFEAEKVKVLRKQAVPVKKPF